MADASRVTGRTFSAAELLETEFPVPRWAVPGLIPEGLSILAAKPKTGKSWAMLGISMAIASGSKALDSVPVQGGDVLYLGLEDTPKRMQERVRILLGPKPRPDRLSLGFAKDWPRSQEGGLAQLEVWLGNHPDARLVVIDTFAKFRSTRTSRDSGYSSDYSDIEPLQEMAGRHQVAIVLVHHQRKMPAEDWIDSISGTLGLAGAADALLGLFRVRGQNAAVLKVTGRDVEECEVGLNFDPTRRTWILLGNAAEVELSTERQEVIQLLRSRSRPETARAIGEATGRSLAAARRTVGRMVNEGQLIQINPGYYILSTTYLSNESYLSYGSDLSEASDPSPPPSDRSDSALLAGALRSSISDSRPEDSEVCVASFTDADFPVDLA